MQGTKNLTKGPIHKQLLNLALPIMATSFIQMAYTLTDMAWVGRLGSKEVAAVGSVGILTWMASSVSLLTKIGSEVSVGQSIGAQNNTDARNFASHNVTLALFISIGLGIVFFLTAYPILGIYNLSPEITDNGVSYLRIVCTAFPFLFMGHAFTGIYNASGRSNIPFYISGMGLILNMILDPLFIFGLNMGTNGAAYATWIAQLGVFSMFWVQLRHRDNLLDKFPFIVKLQPRYTKRILKLGLPVAVFNSLFAFVNMFLGRTASAQGGHIGLMTLTTGGQIEAVTWTTSQGFSTALGAFVAQNYAAREKLRVFKAWHITLLITFIFGSLCTAAFLLWGGEIFSLFVPEKEVYHSGEVYMRISAYSQLFMMLEITTQGIFYGIGRSVPPAVISITFNYLRIPLALLFIHWGMGIEGIWWAITATCVAKGTVLSLWFFIIRKKIFKPESSRVSGCCTKNS